MLTICRRMVLYLCAPVVFGFFMFHSYYGVWFINPTYITWMIGNDDFVTWLLGWQFFRNEPWSWPPGKFLNYGYPHGGAVALTGSIPLLSIPLKLFSHHLPVDFQFFGAWMVLCYVFQACAGALLTRCVTKNPFIILGGSLLFISCPLLIQMGMCCVGTHWLFLFAMWLYIVDYKSMMRLKTLISLSVLLNILAMAVFPYLAAMVLALSCALYVRLWKIDKSISGKFVLTLLTGVIVGDLVCLYLIGGFVIPLQNFSNSAGFDNPTHLDSLFRSGGESRFRFMGAYWPDYLGEPYAYLGLGILLLSLLGTVALLIEKWRPEKKSLVYWKPLLAVNLAFALFAISNKISFNNHLLFKYPLPNFLIKASSPFRECARFFWPCYYFSILLAVYSVIRGFNSRVAALLLWSAVALQFCEFKCIPGKEWNSPLTGQLLTGLVSGGYAAYDSPLKDSVWQHVRDYKGIMIFPSAFKIKQEGDFFFFDYLAANNGMFATCAYLARTNGPQETYLKNEYDRVSKGVLDSSLIYVLTDAIRDQWKPHFLREGVCQVVDGFTICVKNSDNPFCRELKRRGPA